MKFFTEMFFDTRFGVLEFHFECAGPSSASGYHIAVITGTSQTYNFTMQEKGGCWKITKASGLPAWIPEFQNMLSDSLCVHLARQTRKSIH